jgi:Tol biopolymer transport system component
MKRIAMSLIVLTALATVAVRAQDQARLLREAINKETVDGDCKGAIEQYKNVSEGADRALAAQALLRMAECYQKLGDAESQRVYERLVRDFGDQPQAAEARARLARAGGPRTTVTVTDRLVWTERPDEPGKIESLSSDGRVAAMIRTVDGLDDIGLRDMSSGHVRWLGVTKSTDDDIYGVLLSPDLQQVVYSNDLTKNTELCIVATEAGATPRTLINNPDVSDVEPTVWSADGRFILTAISRQDRTWQIAWVSAASGDIKVLKSLDWRFRYDVDGLSLSPDGRYIAYSALATNPSKPRPALPESTETHVYVLAADASSETELIRAPGINSQPVWTSDGGSLLFKSDRSGSAGLWTIPMAGGRAAGAPALVKSDFADTTLMPPTSSGGYFYKKQSRAEHIAIVDARRDGRNSVNAAVGAAETLVGFQPVWSPDGKSIALVCDFPRSRLVVHSLESQEDRSYASNLLLRDLPVWLHDGKALLVSSSASSPPAINARPPSLYRVDVTSGDVKQILPADQDNLRVAVVGLSPDDRTLYVTARTTKWVFGDPPTNPNRILAIDLATGRDRLVFAPPNGEAIYNAVLSPNGRSITMTLSRTIARVDIDGSDFRQLHALSPEEGRVVLAWANDSRAIFFASNRSPQRKVFRIPADGGTPEITGLVLGGRGRFSFSPDGSRVAYASSEAAQQLWALDNLAAVLKGLR